MLPIQIIRTRILRMLVATCTMTTVGHAAETPEDDWSTFATRDEIRPVCSRQADGGRNRQVCLVIAAGEREAVDGGWVKMFPIQGDRHWRFSAWRKTRDIVVARRSAIVKITWQDDDGQLVRGQDDLVRPEYPLDKSSDADGWTEVSDTYWVPAGATRARVELRLRWTSGGTVRWSDIQLREAEQKPSRVVRLAAVHFRPRPGSNNAEKCALFSPLIAEAAGKKADLVCLPESLTYFGSGKTMAEVAEPIPGPSTEYFGTQAAKHDLYIVAGLTERAGSVVYNTAVLLGPDGKLQGKYRKVCLPREEIEAGVTPGRDYPVFPTRFGKLGMMICWDVHFPEVARNLSNNGAEVIAMPIWGGIPTLASARAIENQVYLVTSTYSNPGPDAMTTGVWDHTGKRLVESSSEWGKVFVAEVDLERRKHWNWLGDFKARIARERPANGFEN